MASALTELGEDFLRFIRTDKVVRQNPLYILYALLDDLFIV
jgi:hypothetical protein